MTITHEWSRPENGLSVIVRGVGPITRIQIYGQRCSGTNVVGQTLATNCPTVSLTDELGHKHWFVPPQTVFPEDTLTLVVARNAFDWVRSLHRQPWHAHPDLKVKPFSAFLHSEWHSCWDEHVHNIDPGHPMLGTEMLHERDPATGERFRNCIAKRTAKLRHWAALPARAHNVALISYDAFARAPEAIVAAIAAAAGLDRVASFAKVSSYKGQGYEPYTPHRYDPLSVEDAAYIESWLDPEIEAQFGLSPYHADASLTLKRVAA